MTPDRCITRLRVRYAETDRMGVAYHTHYLVWCEIGRTDWLRAIGTTYRECEESGLFFVVAEAHVRYMAAARYDDVVRIETRMVRVQSRAVTFDYELFRENGNSSVRIATATTKLIVLGPEGAPRAIPAHLLQRFHDGAPA